MKIYKIPTDLRAFIFDIDSTLYTNQAYAFEQVDCQVRQFAKERGISADEARRMVSHNRRWVYVYHIEENFVIVDRILPAKMNKG